MGVEAGPSKFAGVGGEGGGTAAAEVEVAAGRPEVAGVGVATGRSDVPGVGVGVGKGVSKGGTVTDAGAAGVGAALGPQARLKAATAERIKIKMDGFIISFAPWRPRVFWNDLGILRYYDGRHRHFGPPVS